MVKIVLTIIEKICLFFQMLSLIGFLSIITKLEHFLVVGKSIHVDDFIQHKL